MRTGFAALVVVVAVAASVTAGRPAAQQPFRSGVDLVAVDVQVVDGQGNPIPSLRTANFEVSIEGRRRRVVSADLVRFDSTRRLAGQPASTSASPASPAARPDAASRPEEGRIYILAVDTMSFRPADTRVLVSAAKHFVDSLQPNDLVALVPFPIDQTTDATADHAAVLAALDKVVGTRVAVDPCRFNPSDIIDLTSPGAPDLGNPRPDPLIVRRAAEIIETASQCDRIERVIANAKSMALFEEAEIAQRLSSFRSMLQSLAQSPARKTVVLLSAGIISADRTGGRPDIGIDLGAIVGQDAARANATIYTLWVDNLRRDASQASTSGAPRSTDNYQRDAALVSAPLDRLTAGSGGAMFNVIQGGGEFAFERILKETSASYVLGVEPEDADRDGRARQLEVRVTGLPRGASVRSRSWVVVPRSAPIPPQPVAPDVSRSAPPPPVATPPPAPTVSAPPHVSPPSLRRPAPTVPSTAPVPVVNPALVPILRSAAAYVDHFTTAFGNVIGDERYVQDLLAGGRLMARRPAESAQARHRELRSDLVLVRTGDVLGWQMFRDVFEADGAPVRDRQERLSRLFEQPAAGALDQAERIARESARYNIGAVERTLNTPVLTLLFLQAAQQPRFQFTRGTRTPGFSDRVDVVDFRELARPTIIRTVQDADRPASGRVSIDRDTGRHPAD